MTNGDPNRAYNNLGPEIILAAVESKGYLCDGHFLTLNSYENRVYQVGLEDGDPVIAKFYRPGRWSDAQILEEHEFAQELADAEIPVVPPLKDSSGETLHHSGPFRFTLFQRYGGRAPELDNPDHLEQLGRFIGRLHSVGKSKPFQYRPKLDVQTFGINAYQFVLESGFVPREIEAAYRSLAEDLIIRVNHCYQRAGDIDIIRLHGDCHLGNILWRDDRFHIVDLDDARSGPAMQDLWMLLSGDRAYMTARLADILEGYGQFCDFDPSELHLTEALRTLRMINYAAWLAKRWSDPAFPRAFPWFAEPRYWDEHVLALREQAALMDEAPLVWD
ncbi:serine/threonine protein kinase [Pseudomonadota bacterium]